MSRSTGAALAALLTAATPGHAVVCTPDDVPAATLLFPYFAVDTTPCASTAHTARGTVTNTSDAEVAVAVTYWTNAAVPVHRTTHTLAARATLTLDFAAVACEATLRPRFLGAADGGTCSAFAPRETDLAEGYATVDVVASIAALPPVGDAAYYAAPHLSNANVLTGSWRTRDFVGFGETGTSFPAVAIEALPATFGAGDVTFYGRYNGASGADAREPLPTAYAGPYELGGVYGLTTQAIAWREADAALAPFACAAGPTWPPLGHSNVRGTGRGAVVVASDGIARAPIANLFERATQAVFLEHEVREPEGPGDLTYNVVANFQHPFTPYGDGRHGQAWLGMVTFEGGQAQRSVAATPLDSACTQGPTDIVVPARDTGAP